jgi:head-tail adaptor
MDASKLDRRLTLQRGVEGDDGFSTAIDWSSPTELATVWANFIPLSGGERAAASQTQAFGKANWEIRKDSAWADLNAKDRMIDKRGSIDPDDWRIFDILNVTEPRRGWLFVETVSAGDS